MYTLIRYFFFKLDAEQAHELAMKLLKALCSVGMFRMILRWLFCFENNRLQKKIVHLDFKNPVGLAAGFDKNAEYLEALDCLGFGCVEIGTVTPLPQPGNDKPRVFRLIKDKALINRMGFNNKGAEAAAINIKNFKKKYPHSKLIIGGNIGKNKITPNEEAYLDYEKCFLALQNEVDYFVVNVSSPNTPNLRALQEKESLKKILTHLQQLNQSNNVHKPILLKIAPDLSLQQLNDVIELALEIQLDGLVATNTTISRENLLTDKQQIEAMGNGGLSGLPLKKTSTHIIQYIHQQTQGKIPIIASGGVFTGADALEKLNAGASAVQVWTGFIYEGPAIAKTICKYLAACLKK